MTVTITPWNDPASWNEFVARSPHPHFQQTWEWGELAPYLGGKAERVAALKDGQLAGMMQIFINRLSVTSKTQLYVPRGPAVCGPDIQVLGPLFDAARSLGSTREAIGIRVEPDALSCDAGWKQTLSALGFHPSYPPSQPRSSWVLAISPNEDALLAGMKPKTRYNIRLAGRKGVEVEEVGPDDLDTFYKLFKETAQRDDFFIHTEAVYRRMYELFRSAGVFGMLLARHRGEAIAGITLVRCGPICWYLQGASSNQHRNLMATYLLQWEGIRWARRHGCTLYDFRAVPDILREDQDMYGVYRFKEGFGGHQVTSLHTYAAPYNPALFGLWQLYFAGRFAAEGWRRRREVLPARQFA